MATHVPDPTQRAVEMALGYVGLPYVFAGGDLDGPTNGGFDRAGLARRVVYAVSSIGIGRTLDDQLNSCQPLAFRAPSSTNRSSTTATS